MIDEIFQTTGSNSNKSTQKKYLNYITIKRKYPRNVSGRGVYTAWKDRKHRSLGIVKALIFSSFHFIYLLRDEMRYFEAGVPRNDIVGFWYGTPTVRAKKRAARCFTPISHTYNTSKNRSSGDLRSKVACITSTSVRMALAER